MRVLLTILAFLAAATGTVAHAADSAVALIYHRFGDDRHPSTNIRRDQFEAHLEHLRSGGFNVIPLEDLIAALRDGTPLSDKAVVITIDDAYRSVREVAHPLLRRYGYPYTVFVATDSIDEGLPDFMSWDDMRALAGDGVTFANHGGSHTSLIDDSESGGKHRAWVREDVQRGMRRLREELDPLEGVFAYPYGEFNEQTISIVDDLGYEFAFGQQSGAIGPMSAELTLPRFPMNETYATLDQFRPKVSSLPLPVEAVEPGAHEIETRLPLVEFELAGGIDGADFSGLACYVSGQGRVAVDWLVPNERFRSGPDKPLAPGRTRINCTAPAGGGRYYWYSHPWIVVDP